LLYGARDTEHNGALVLRDYLAARRPGTSSSKKARLTRSGLSHHRRTG
jgi:hypothetical protein